MADGTYQPKVYEKQGGAELVVASSGKITVESGGYINVYDGGYIKLPVVTESTSANASDFGVSILASTGTKEKFGLDAGSKGEWKFVEVTVPQATGFVCLGSSSITINYRGTSEQYLKFSGDAGVTLVADTTSTWFVAGESSTGAIATSTSGTS